MYSEDRYYEPEDDDSEEIQERIDYKLKNENNPFTAENIRECFFEDGFEGHWETIATLLQQGNTAAAGTVFSSVIYTYWEDRSENEVLDNI